jgi:hypothetical protein
MKKPPHEHTMTHIIPVVRISTWLAALITLSSLTLSVSAQTASYIRNLRLTTSAIILQDTGSENYFGNSINGTTFQQNALLNYSDYQYAVYYNSARQLCAARRPLSSTTWTTITFPYTTSPDLDDHRSPAIGICPIDSSVHIAFDCHATPLRYIKTGANGATSSWSSSLFSAEQNYFASGENISQFTYPRFIVAKNNKLLLFWRELGSQSGSELFNEYSGSSGWSNKIAVTTNTGTYNSSTARATYVNPITYYNNKLQLSWAWREKGSSYCHDLYYATSDDNGRTWKNDAGTVVGTSGTNSQKISVTSAAKVYTINEDRSLSNQHGQAVDSSGHAHVVLRHATTANGTTNAYYHYTNQGIDSGFRRTAMPMDAGRRAKVYCDSQDRLWFVANIAGKINVYVAKKSENWATWRQAYVNSDGFTFMNDLNGLLVGDRLFIMAQREGASNTSTESSLFVYELSLSQ